MVGNPNRQIDKTSLSIDLAEERGLIHRDYIAHAFRWSHVVKFLNQGHRYKDAIILDVGCGKEMPLAKTMYVNKMAPKYYVGVDANKFDIPEMLVGKKIPISVWSETDFCALDPGDVGLEAGNAHDATLPLKATKDLYLNIAGDMFEMPNVVVCLEVLEHVAPEHCRRILKHFLALTSPDCHYFISTPCYNGSAAENHINEMRFSPLGALMEDLGYKVEGVYGTFASISDYVDQLSAVSVYDKSTNKVLSTVDLRDVFAALRNYYDTNVLAVIFAPLFPAHSRNCLWHLTRESDPSLVDQVRMFPKLEQQPTPWGQHPRWIELSGFGHAHSDECVGKGGAGDLTCGMEGIWLTK